ncbi:hypothetical protein AURDEDRAFT_43389, partial [Auricularia subglabra TFB-10046 SS5]
WLNHLLMPYVARMGILPETQIASHKGVQVRDLTSFLSGVQCWAQRHKTTVYALKRDQMKGFDRLAPQGFYDAIVAGNPGAMTLRTLSAKKHEVHMPDDRLELSVTMVEATNDSYIFAVTLQTLLHFVLAMERFQFAYGWLTQWTKTILSIAGPIPEGLADHLDMPSVSPAAGADPMLVTFHPVPVHQGSLQFLNCSIDDGKATYDTISDIINNFSFPRLAVRLPITLIRKIVEQNIISRARPRIALQPLERSQANSLDKAISALVHRWSRFLYLPNSLILNLPIALHGLGFSSIERLNDAMASDVTASVVGPSTAVFAVHGRANGILQGEVFAQIAAHVLAARDASVTLFTDHMNTTRLLHDLMHNDGPTRLLRINARSYYRWLVDLRRNHRETGLSVEYTRGHANDAAARGSVLNSLTDYYASTAQGYAHDLPSAPVPTFFMDDYTFATEADGWIESSPRLFFMHHRARQQARDLETGHGNRMVSSLYSPSHPEFPYTRALSAYSALVQLYARSGQLPTAETLSERARSNPLPPFCRFGCRTVESDFHLFVECPRFNSYRSEAGERLCAR